MLTQGNGALDPGEVAVIQEAFEIAWRFLQYDPVLGDINAAHLRERLARELLLAADGHETDVRRLADRGILAVRRAVRRGISAMRPGGHASMQPSPTPG
jgi:hypothetical protein